METNKTLTPTELLEKYPAAVSAGITKEMLGNLLKHKFLKGHFDRNSRTSLINEGSFIALMRYRNELINSDKVEI